MLKIKSILSIEDLKSISSEVTELYFTTKFNTSINDKIPQWIKKIEFSEKSIFNIECDLLPESVEELLFGNSKDHSLKEIENFPKNLKVLKLGNKFNEELEKNILPKNLKILDLGSHYNQKIKKGVLPSKLLELRIGHKYNKIIDENVLPESVTTILVKRDNCYFFNDNYAPEYEVLECKNTILLNYNQYNYVRSENRYMIFRRDEK